MLDSVYFGSTHYQKLAPEHSLVDFSDWVLMLHNVRTKYWYEYFKREVPREPGVYEIGVDDTPKYVGATRNLRRRHKQYCAHGSHLSRKIESALRRHGRVWFRWHVDRGYRFTEKRLRACVNYEWNRL